MSIKIEENQHKILQDFQNNAPNETRSLILNVLFRKISITRKGKIRQELTPDEYKLLSDISHISIPIINQIVPKFLKNIKKIHDFMSSKPHRRGYDPKLFKMRVKSFLRLIHRFSPIFDFYRAEVNLIILHDKLKKILFLPRMTTQIAITIFVTDKNDEKTSIRGPILQNNLRYLSCCSAYAFHRTRNMLKL
ncbi:MAG: hypothetical protein ACFFAS_14905 [Promethearchaeota archaeon]